MFWKEDWLTKFLNNLIVLRECRIAKISLRVLFSYKENNKFCTFQDPASNELDQ